MAYYTGTVNSFADIKTAIENAAVAEGYTLSSGILSKDGCFYQVTSAAAYVAIRGGTSQTGTTLNNPSSYCTIFQPTDAVNGVQISWPASYEIHAFANPSELYFCLNYNSDFYQFLSIGKSDIPSIGGTGGWLAGSSSVTSGTTNGSKLNISGSSINFSTSSPVATVSCGLPFCGKDGSSTWTSSSSSVMPHTMINTGLTARADGWNNCASGSSPHGTLTQMNYLAGLMTALPNQYNSATVLLPIKGIMRAAVTSNLQLVAQPRNIRMCRLDVHLPGEVITYGVDNWKLYPAYRRDVNNRNGNAGTTVEYNTGTLGFAIRYQGA